MKRICCILLTALLLIGTLTGCGSRSGEGKTERTSTASGTGKDKVSRSAEEILYRDVLDRLAALMTDMEITAGNGKLKIDKDNDPYCFRRIVFSRNLRYAFPDLDENGTPELIIYRDWREKNPLAKEANYEKKGTVYTVYTISKGRPVCLTEEDNGYWQLNGDRTLLWWYVTFGHYDSSEYKLCRLDQNEAQLSVVSENSPDPWPDQYTIEDGLLLDDYYEKVTGKRFYLDPSEWGRELSADAYGYSDGLGFLYYGKYAAYDTKGRIVFNFLTETDSYDPGPISWYQFTDGAMVVKNLMLDTEGHVIAAPVRDGYDYILSEIAEGYVVIGKAVDPDAETPEIATGLMDTKGEIVREISTDNALSRYLSENKSLRKKIATNDFYMNSMAIPGQAYVEFGYGKIYDMLNDRVFESIAHYGFVSLDPSTGSFAEQKKVDWQGLSEHPEDNGIGYIDADGNVESILIRGYAPVRLYDGAMLVEKFEETGTRSEAHFMLISLQGDTLIDFVRDGDYRYEFYNGIDSGIWNGTVFFDKSNGIWNANGEQIREAFPDNDELLVLENGVLAGNWDGTSSREELEMRFIKWDNETVDLAEAAGTLNRSVKILAADGETLVGTFRAGMGDAVTFVMDMKTGEVQIVDK